MTLGVEVDVVAGGTSTPKLSPRVSAARTIGMTEKARRKFACRSDVVMLVISR